MEKKFLYSIYWFCSLKREIKKSTTVSEENKLPSLEKFKSKQTFSFARNLNQNKLLAKLEV
jgi:hypothetical protein